MDFSNGDKYEGKWKNGVIHGYGMLYYSNGESYPVKYENGKMVLL